MADIVPAQRTEHGGAPHMRAAGQPEHAHGDAFGQRTEGAGAAEAGIVTGASPTRTLSRTAGAVVTAMRSSVVTTATRQ